MVFKCKIQEAQGHIWLWVMTLKAPLDMAESQWPQHELLTLRPAKQDHETSNLIPTPPPS